MRLGSRKNSEKSITIISASKKYMVRLARQEWRGVCGIQDIRR